MVERGTMTDIDLFGLKGAHVVITGASGGIGLAVVGLFKELGTKISAQGNRQTSLLPKSESVNAIKADATNEAEVEAFYKEACTKFGSPDVLIGMDPSNALFMKFVMGFSKKRRCQLPI